MELSIFYFKSKQSLSLVFFYAIIDRDLYILLLILGEKMEVLTKIFNLFLHLDKHLVELFQNFGVWSYLLLFLCVFCETGLVITPFLPGDSLLFMLGAIGAGGEIDLFLISVLLIVAAILGDAVNYHIGQFLGPRIFGKSRFLKQEYLEKAHQFYEKHGGKTIIIARFIPIIRTFAPFVAGIGKMTYWRFFLYNVVGAFIWIIFFIVAGYYFGNIPFVEDNFALVILVIIVMSVIPAIYEYLISKKQKAKSGSERIENS